MKKQRFFIDANQYLPNGFGNPASTYWYIVDSEGRIYHHSDNKFRFKPLKNITGTKEWKTIKYGRCVWFNGDETTGSDHETFAIFEDKTEWDFCKTARKPYDLLVCACLIAAGKILGYKTDGTVEDWKPAFEFYNSVMNTKSIPSRKFLNIN